MQVWWCSSVRTYQIADCGLEQRGNAANGVKDCFRVSKSLGRATWTCMLRDTGRVDDDCKSAYIRNNRTIPLPGRCRPGFEGLTMAKQNAAAPVRSFSESDLVFESAAEVFRVMSAPMRLKIISSLCNGEKNVGQLLSEIDTTQPNMSQHLNTLYKAGVLGKRRDGVQIHYRIINDRVVTLCTFVSLNSKT